MSARATGEQADSWVDAEQVDGSDVVPGMTREQADGGAMDVAAVA